MSATIQRRSDGRYELGDAELQEGDMVLFAGVSPGVRGRIEYDEERRDFVARLDNGRVVHPIEGLRARRPET